MAVDLFAYYIESGSGLLLPDLLVDSLLEVGQSVHDLYEMSVKLEVPGTCMVVNSQ